MQGLVQLVEGPVHAGLELEELIRAYVVLGEPLSVGGLEQRHGSIRGRGWMRISQSANPSIKQQP